MIQASSDLAGILQRLCDSEISFAITHVACTHFDVTLGDEMNGIVATKNFRHIQDAVAWLSEQAIANYPESDFACAGASHDIQHPHRTEVSTRAQ